MTSENEKLIAEARSRPKPTMPAPNRIALWSSDRLCHALADALAKSDREKLERYERGLQSIARNSCCDQCQEAAKVARQALEGPRPLTPALLPEEPNHG